MLVAFLSGLKVFILFFTLFVIMRNAFAFLKVLYLKQGKYNASERNLLILALSLSYVLTLLII